MREQRTIVQAGLPSLDQSSSISRVLCLVIQDASGGKVVTTRAAGLLEVLLESRLACNKSRELQRKRRYTNFVHVPASIKVRVSDELYSQWRGTCRMVHHKAHVALVDPETESYTSLRQ